MSLIKTTSKSREEVLSLRRITKPKLRELCKKDKLYLTPELNDVLYLHYQGFQHIENLEEYTDLKCLWLESNAISEIQGLDNQKKLKCLFLHNNLIRRIENLDCCTELDTINLSSNHIRKIENCSTDILPGLSSLNLSSNYLTDYESLRELEKCKTLTVLDLSNNRIDDILVVKIFARMPALRVLVLNGNPVVSKLSQYRKTLILECKELTYLDSRPVFPRDRACAEAWKRGGYEEERNENQRWNRKDRDRMRENVNSTIRMRNKYLSADKQLKLFTASDSENEKDDSQDERDKDKNGPILNVNDDIWDEVRNDESNNNSSSSEETSEPTGSSLSALDSSDPNIYESEELEKKKEITEQNNFEEVEDVTDLPDLIGNTEDEILDYDKNAQPLSFLPVSTEGVEEIESDVDTTMFDMVDKMLENSGKSAAEYAKEAGHKTKNIDDTKTNEEIIQEKIANDEMSASLGQLTNNVSLAMEELEKAQDQLTDNIDNVACSDIDESEKSAEWSEDKLLLIEGNEFVEINDIIDKECPGEEIQKGKETTNVKDHDEHEDDYDFEDNKVLKSFKKEEKELKELLQRLEDKNELIYGDIKLTRNSSKPNLLNDEYERANEDSIKICENIINDILENLEIDKNAVKNFKFVDLDEYEKENLSKPTEENNEPKVKTLNSVVTNFNKMMQEAIQKNREEKRQQQDEFIRTHRKSVGTTASQKTECINNLLKSPSLAEFNADTHETLTKKLETVRVKQEKHLKKLVDRVYAQRDKYNDTLEVVDNRLVVVKQDTGEIEELSHTNFSRQVDFDSDSESEDDLTVSDFVWEGVPLVEAHRLDTKKQANISAFSAAFDYKPTDRLPINKVMQNFNKDNSDSESSEKLYSLPDNTNAIGNIRNIDKEFIKDLDFEEVEFDEKACGDHTVLHSSRSDEELQTFLRLEKLTAQNNFEPYLLEHIGQPDQSNPLQKTQQNMLLQNLREDTKNCEKGHNIPSKTDLQQEILMGTSDLYAANKHLVAIENLDQQNLEMAINSNMNTLEVQMATIPEMIIKHEQISSEIILTPKYVKYETLIMSEIKIKEMQQGDELFFNEKVENILNNNENSSELNVEKNRQSEENINNKTESFPLEIDETVFLQYFEENEVKTEAEAESDELEVFKDCENTDLGIPDGEDEEEDINNIYRNEVHLQNFEGNEVRTEAESDEIEVYKECENTDLRIPDGEDEKEDINNIYRNEVLLQNFEENEVKTEAESDEIEDYKECEYTDLGIPEGEDEKEGEHYFDAENFGDNVQVISYNEEDNGNAFLVLQSAKLFEYIGDGGKNENVNLTCSKDCTGTFISAIDDEPNTDDEKEESKVITMNDMSVQCDAEI